MVTFNFKKAWWKESTVYQIYPASYMDSNGDGVGDIKGIISKLDYIKDIGVDIVWLCPCYKSPQVDMGYDISDYKDIYEKYGTLEDIDELIKQLHRRGLKFLMDLVVNHTSDQHEWFRSALTSKTSPYRDFYIWKKPKYDADGNRLPPNNWLSYFGGSVWEWDEPSGEYYLHLFAKEQPDLNWENPKVVEAVHDIVKFWLDKGVDGFRMDVINFISKDPLYPDAPVVNPGSKYQDGSKFYSAGPRLHEYLAGLGKILKEHDGFSVGEMPAVKDPKDIIDVVAFERNELNMIFQFEHVDIDQGVAHKFTPRSWPLTELKSIFNKWETFMQENDGWNAIYIENHDQPRSVSRFGCDEDEYRVNSSKGLAALFGLMSGTIFLYEGQELGMRNVPKSWPISKYRDIETLNHYNELIANNATEEELKICLEEVQKKSRDNARTPIQWDSSEYAGFSTVKPWIDVNDDYKKCNAAAQVNDPESVLSFWRTVFALRKAHKDIFVYGLFELVDAVSEDVFAYKRYYDDKSALVIASFSKKEVKWDVPVDLVKAGKIRLQNYEDAEFASTVILRPFETIVYIYE
ncbi:glycoside hydrolase superfamily [Dipodascopsis uninucleata]